MKTKNIGYIAGKIKSRNKSYISGQLHDKNGTTEIAQVVYDLEVLDLDGNTLTLRTQYENVANQDSYLHFFYNQDNLILDTFKCYSDAVKYITKNSELSSIKFFVSAFIFIAFALFLFTPLSGLMIPFQSGAKSLALSILTTIPVALDTMAIVMSGIVGAVYLHEELLSNIPKYLKYRKYKAFKHSIVFNNEKIKAAIFK